MCEIVLFTHVLSLSLSSLQGNEHAARALDQILTLGDNTKSENQISPRFFSKFFSSNQDASYRGDRTAFLLSEKQHLPGDDSDESGDSDFDDDDAIEVRHAEQVCVCVCVCVREYVDTDSRALSSRLVAPSYLLPTFQRVSRDSEAAIGAT